MTYYMESQFAFKKHPEIGPANGSLTPEELSALVDFAKPLGLDILGNQQSFGHFGAILAQPECAAARETGDVLSPVKEGTYKLLDGTTGGALGGQAVKACRRARVPVFVRGGTILGTSNRDNPFHYLAKGASRPVNRSKEALATFKHLKNYATEKNKVIDFKDIDITFYDDFIQYLQESSPIKPTRSKKIDPDKQGDKKTERGKLAVNTIGKKIQTLKTFLNAATDEKLNNYDAYKSKKFVKLSEESESIYLNESDLEKLYKKDFKDRPGLERVRDLFLVGCWTGCRFSDISQITPESISKPGVFLLPCAEVFWLCV